MQHPAPPRSFRRSAVASLVMRRLAAATALVLTAFVAGCGDDDDDPVSPAAGITGTYALETVNDEDVPVVVVTNGADTGEITAGSLTLNNNLSFTSSLSIRTTIGGQATDETLTESGTFTRSGNTITLTSGGESVTATLSNNNTTITLTEDDEDLGTIELVFQR